MKTSAPAFFIGGGGFVVLDSLIQNHWLAMHHRHLNHQRFMLAAIDDVISRGRWNDWAKLRQAALADASLLKKIEQVCRPRVACPYAQRYHFWMNYAEAHRTDA